MILPRNHRFPLRISISGRNALLSSSLTAFQPLRWPEQHGTSVYLQRNSWWRYHLHGHLRYEHPCTVSWCGLTEQGPAQHQSLGFGICLRLFAEELLLFCHSRWGGALPGLHLLLPFFLPPLSFKGGTNVLEFLLQQIAILTCDDSIQLKQKTQQTVRILFTYIFLILKKKKYNKLIFILHIFYYYIYYEEKTTAWHHQCFVIWLCVALLKFASMAIDINAAVTAFPKMCSMEPHGSVRGRQGFHWKIE